MDRLRRFIDCYIETETCNLRCHYCYITQKRKFNSNIIKFKHAPQEIRKALSKERLGGNCLLNLCAGGETLIASEIICVIEELLREGHYVMVVTNATLTHRFEEIAKLDPNLLRKLFFKCSFHYLELKRLGLMDVFFSNIKIVADAGASYTVELTPSDELIPYIQEIKKICMDKLGALCHVTIARDDRTKRIEVLSQHPFEEFKAIWGSFDSTLFDFKTKIFYEKRREFCYAGDWSLYLNLNTGILRQCLCGVELGNIYDDISKPLKFEAVGHNCTLPHCYNGHVYLTLGTIPELLTPTYAEVRDRTDQKGENWLQPEMRNFMSQRLVDNNTPYTDRQKQALIFKSRYSKVKFFIRRVCRKLKII